MEIRKGMYALPQAGNLVHNKLKILLKSQCYYPAPHTPNLWTHKNKDIYFSLVVYNFSVKYTKESDARNLIRLLQIIYTVTTDFTGAKDGGSTYHGIIINVQYNFLCQDTLNQLSYDLKTSRLFILNIHRINISTLYILTRHLNQFQKIISHHSCNHK